MTVRSPIAWSTVVTFRLGFCRITGSLEYTVTMNISITRVVCSVTLALSLLLLPVGTRLCIVVSLGIR